MREKHLPPRLFLNFFRWYCHPKLVDHIEGDLLEEYGARVMRSGKKSADMRFVIDVILLFRQGIIKPTEVRVNLINYAMFKSYFKIGWRSLKKSKGFSIINITGLGVGVAACLLITLFVIHEMSYDKHVPNSGNIYRLTQYFNMDGKDEWGIHHPANMAATLQSDFGEIEKAGRIMDNPQRYGAGENEIQVEGQTQQFHEAGFAYADQSILDILHVRFVHGNAGTALTKPFSIVLSESKARKYFKSENPVGKALYLNGQTNQAFTITGVMEDFAGNSNFEYDFFLSLNDALFFEEGEEGRWSQRNFMVLLQVRPGTHVSSFETKLTDIMFNKYILPFYRSSGRTKNAELLATASRLELQRLLDIHLYSSRFDHAKSRGDIRFIWIFGSIAVFILIIASINFINLSTAKSASRAKEVGLKKVVGSGKGSLVFQFLTESFIITLFAFILGLAMMTLAMPYFANLAQRTINIPWTSNWFLPSLFAGVIIVSILAGLYPSFYLSRFKPVNVLKGRVSAGAKSPGLRSGLVIFQFTISFVLVASALIVQNQMAFIMTKDLGFDKNQVIQIHGVTSAMNATTFKDQLRQIPGVSNASNSSYIPVEGGHRNSSNVEPLPDGAQENFQSQFWRVDEDYIETMGMSLLQGRNFVAGRDTTRVPPAIINEAMAKALGYQDPIGHKISERQPLEIIGVVKNFNFQSLEEQIQPLTLVFNNNSTITSVRVNTGNIPGLLTELERTWKKFSENAEFKYTFMDESYARTYENVRRMGVILNSFTGLAILIACLGLFGLSAYVIEQRKKELGVRKVLGASTVTVFNLLVKNFIGMVAISFIVAIPISIYLMNKWLESYAYRIDISWQIFVVTGAGALLITLLTISYQAVSAAWANPVSSLRSE